MKVGVEARLFLLSVALTTVGAVLASAVLEGDLRRTVERRVEDELEGEARAAQLLLERVPDLASTVGDLDPLADALGTPTSLRVTIVSADGRVLGDTELSPSQIAAVDNHGNRPEIAAALREGFGLSRRYSATLDHTRLYHAVRFERPDGFTGVVRTSRTLDEVDAAADRLRSRIALAALLLALVAVAMALLAARYLRKAARTLVDHARAVAEGRPTTLDSAYDGAVGSFAGSVSRLGEELRDTVAELAEQRARLDAVLQGMSEAVLALDAEGRVTLVNHAAHSMLELPDRPEGRALMDLIRLPEVRELLDTARRGDALRTRFSLTRPVPRTVLAHIRPHAATEGSVLVLTDITELRRLEAVRRDFVANVSHELRTPVAVIRANAETLLGGALTDPDAGPRFLEAIDRHASRLSTLITDLLDLAELEAGRRELEVISVSPRVVADRVLAVLQARAGARGIDLTADELSPSLRVLAAVDPLEQVLTNLLDNAVKYGGEKSRVEVAPAPASRPGRLRIEIRDDGPGVPVAKRERLFERFYRVDPGRSRAMGGTGLGLSIVKHLVEAMDGEVGYAVGSPGGSVFWFELPVG